MKLGSVFFRTYLSKEFVARILHKDSMKVKIYWLFVIILLFMNFTLIESIRGYGRAFRNRQYRHNRRYIYRPKSRSSLGQYYEPEKIETKNHVYVERAKLPDPMQNEKRLNYLATNKKEGRSNIGRLLSGS